MNKVKGITVGTYLTKTLKDSKDKGHTTKEVCSKCKMKYYIDVDVEFEKAENKNVNKQK